MLLPILLSSFWCNHEGTIQEQKVEQAIVAAPMWPIQAWFPMFTNMMVSIPIIFNSSNMYLFHPADQSFHHPLAQKMKLMAALLSADNTNCQIFQQKLPTSYCSNGRELQQRNMRESLKNWNYIVIKGVKIPCLYM